MATLILGMAYFLLRLAYLLLCVSWYILQKASIAVTILVCVVAYILYPRKRTALPNEPPFYESNSNLGPLEMLLDPLRFIVDRNKEYGTKDKPASSFATTMLGSYTVFISDPEDVTMVMSKAMEEVCNFPEPYEGAIRAGFGRMILAPQTVHAQVQLLKDNLTTTKLKSYLQPSLKLAQEIIAKLTPNPKGVVDLTDLARKAVFSNAIQNFLGKELLVNSDNYFYDEAFDSFDMVKQAFPIMFPTIHGMYQRYIQKRDDFDRSVLAIVEKREKQEALRLVDKTKTGADAAAADTAQETRANAAPHYDNVLDELIERRREQGLGSLTWGCIIVLINLVKFFVFGTGFNTFNFVVFVFFWLIEQPKTVWDALRAEQSELDAKYGHDVTFKKLDDMKKLREIVNKQMALNCFPLLLRKVKKEFKLKNGQVVAEGALVAFSPRMQCEFGAINIIFGGGAHPCPAEWYSYNSILIVLSTVIKRFTITKVISAKKPDNRRLITFPNLPPVIGEYELVENILAPISPSASCI